MDKFLDRTCRGTGELCRGFPQKWSKMEQIILTQEKCKYDYLIIFQQLFKES